MAAEIMTFSSSEDEEELERQRLDRFEETLLAQKQQPGETIMSDPITTENRIKLEGLQRAIAEHSASINDLRHQRQAIQQQCSSFAAERAALEAEIAHLDDEMDRLMSSTSSASSALKLKIHNLRQQQDVLHVGVDENLERARAAQREIQVLDERLNTTEKKLQELHRSAEDRQRQSDMLRRADGIAGGIRVQRELSAGRRRARAEKQFFHAAHSSVARREPEPAHSGTSSSSQPVDDLIRETHAKHMQQQQLQLQADREELERRSNAVQQLKINRDRLSEQDRRRATLQHKRKQQAQDAWEAERQALLDKGENPDIVLRQRRQEEARRRREKQQAVRERELATRLAAELDKQRTNERREKVDTTALQRKALMGTTVRALRDTTAVQLKATNLPSSLDVRPAGPASKAAAAERTQGPLRNSRASGSSDSSGSAHFRSRADSVEVPHACVPEVTSPEPAAAGVDPMESGAVETDTPLALPTLGLALPDLDFGDDSSDEESLITAAGHQHTPGPSTRSAAPRRPTEVNVADTQALAAAAFSDPKFAAAWQMGSEDPTSDDMPESATDSISIGDATLRATSASAAPKANKSTKYKGMSKLEQERMVSALERQRQNMVKPQVISGRTFEGPPFVSSLTAVEFIDFDIGKTYTQKVTFTNVSYGFNSFKVLPCEAEAIQYEYQPPGSISAGLSSEVQVVFHPQVNRDLETVMVLQTQSAEVRVPIICRRKRCNVQLVRDTIDLGTVFLGETCMDIIELVNHGGLATKYDIVHVDGTPLDTHGQTGNDQPSSKGVGEAGPDHAKSDEDVTSASLAEASPPEGDESDETALAVSSTVLSAPVFAYDGAFSGFLAPRTGISIGVHFTPQSEGAFEDRLRISFSDSDAKPLELTVVGQCRRIPVFFKDTSVDFRICCQNHEYVVSVPLCNTNSSSSSKVAFSVPPEAASTLQVKPVGCVLQPNSTQSVQLCLAPRADSLTVLEHLADRETGDMRVPVTMNVEGQALPSQILVKAHLTPNNLLVRPTHLDFGRVGVYETVVRSVELCNESALPQRFAFTKLPDYVTICPGDGFGTLLPFETVRVDVLFAPPRHPHDDDDQKFQFDLQVVNELASRPQRITCIGTGVVPPLVASTSRVAFATTCYGDSRTQCIYLRNTTSQPWSFQLQTSAGGNLPLAFSPCAGRIGPGQMQHVWLRFAPSRPTEAQSSHTQVSRGVLRCFVSADGEVVDSAHTFSVDLELPASEPFVLVRDTSGAEGESAQLLHDFGPRCLATKDTQSWTLTNISQHEVICRCSALDTAGAFRLVRALRPLAPGASQQVIVAFQPDLAMAYQEDFDINCNHQRVRLRLRGQGVVPQIVAAPVVDVPAVAAAAQLAQGATMPHAPWLSFGDTLVMTSVTRTLALQNKGSVAVPFSTAWASASESAPAPVRVAFDAARNCPRAVRRAGGSDERNRDGCSAFSVLPARGVLAPGERCDLVVTFAPDHCSEFYRDSLMIQYRGQPEPCRVDVRGRGRVVGPFCVGHDGAVESTVSHPLALPAPSLPAMSVYLRYSLREANANGERPAITRDLYLGYQFEPGPPKRSADLSLEPLESAATQAGLSISAGARGTLKPDELFPLRLSFTPHASLAVGMTVETTTAVTIKGPTTVTTSPLHIRIMMVE